MPYAKKLENKKPSVVAEALKDLVHDDLTREASTINNRYHQEGGKN